MSAVLLRGAAEQGLIYSLVALALYLSYRTLNIADLTVDGSFTSALPPEPCSRPSAIRCSGSLPPLPPGCLPEWSPPCFKPS